MFNFYEAIVWSVNLIVQERLVLTPCPLTESSPRSEILERTVWGFCFVKWYLAILLHNIISDLIQKHQMIPNLQLDTECGLLCWHFSTLHLNSRTEKHSRRRCCFSCGSVFTGRRRGDRAVQQYSRARIQVGDSSSSSSARTPEFRQTVQFSDFIQKQGCAS